MESTGLTVDQLYDEIVRQKASTVQLIKDTAQLQQATHATSLSEINGRFNHFTEVIRHLQKQVNKLTPEDIRSTVRQIVTTDPLIPRADKFEETLTSYEKRLHKSEVSCYNLLSIHRNQIF